VRDDERRARIMAAVTEHDTAAGAGELVQRLCMFAVEEMALSGCALVLMSGAESASVLAGAGRHTRTVTGLRTELGKGPTGMIAAQLDDTVVNTLAPAARHGVRERLLDARHCPERG
jgi:hypothetical protein